MRGCPASIELFRSPRSYGSSLVAIGAYFCHFDQKSGPLSKVRSGRFVDTLNHKDATLGRGRCRRRSKTWIGLKSSGMVPNT
jgi:hypothetical protein